jgi:hypothetical protein
MLLPDEVVAAFKELGITLVHGEIVQPTDAPGNTFSLGCSTDSAVFIVHGADTWENMQKWLEQEMQICQKP